LEDFQQSLMDIANDLQAEPMTTSLHDATLRNMVLAEQQ
jgi:hypothetical protein